MTNNTDWRPTASLEAFKLRARVLAEIRAFFLQRDVMEVETPLLSHAAATDPHLENFYCRYQGLHAAEGQTLYLQTSPEFAMKRLLAAGSGSIYQICKAFRNGEAGRQHNPEFTLLEWYRLDFDHHQLMAEVEALISRILPTKTAKRISYRELFLQRLDLDPFSFKVSQARECLRQRNITPPELGEDAQDDWLTLLMTHLIEPGLKDAWFVYDFPPSQAMLSRIQAANPPVAQRFELFVDGVELANGFYELTNAAEQQQRFEADLSKRDKSGLESVPIDQTLLAALDHGLPDCAGVALGVDRLLMLASKKKDISEVLSFSISNS